MVSNEECLPPQGELELASINSLSRSSVVHAYTTWTDVSETEKLCLETICDSSASVLDIGCGAGRHAGWLNGRFSKYLGVDASQPMIDAAKNNFPELSFQAADILEISFTENSWDTILLMGNVLDFLNPIGRRQALLEKCHAWLHNGGTIVGSSHLTEKNQPKGYYKEDYHSSEIVQYRLSTSEMIEEVENVDLEIMLLARDYKKKPAYWAYWVARKAD